MGGRQIQKAKGAGRGGGGDCRGAVGSSGEEGGGVAPSPAAAIAAQGRGKLLLVGRALARLASRRPKVKRRGSPSPPAGGKVERLRQLRVGAHGGGGK